MSSAIAAFRVDASAKTGGGHAMRCLTLSHRLAAAGFDCRFFVNPEFGEVVPSEARRGLAIEIVPDRGFAAALAAVYPAGVDLLVYDHYGLDADTERTTSAMARCTLVIDDLVDRPHECELLLDQTVGREATDYAALVPKDCTVLAGGAFALLRPEFGMVREEALARRRSAAPTGTVLISMGLTDVGGISLPVAVAALGIPAVERVQVVLGAKAPSRDALLRLADRDPKLEIREAGAVDIARLMAEADVAIGAAGATSWERCCLGLPTVMLKLADNQTKVIAELTLRGAAWLATDADEAGARARHLLKDRATRAEMTEAAARLIDGNGARRVVDAIKVRLKAA